MIWVLALGKFDDEEVVNDGDGHVDDKLLGSHTLYSLLQFLLSPSPSSSAWEFTSARFLDKNTFENLSDFIFTTNLTIISISVTIIVCSHLQGSSCQ